MLIREVTTADDKLRLLKTIFDNWHSPESVDIYDVNTEMGENHEENAIHSRVQGRGC